MVARGFRWNTNWKEIKGRVEEVMEESGVAYGRVQVIGQRASFAFIRFDDYANKQEFKYWLKTHGKGVKEAKGIWFGDNIDKDASLREKAVGKVVSALMMSREGREDVDRDFRRGLVYVRNGTEDVVVAKWDKMLKVMMFQGEGKNIRETYKKLMAERKGEDEGDFSE